MTRISPLIPPPPPLMFTHRYDQISISAFLCLITGVFCFGWCGGCCSYGNEQIQVKQIRWIWGRDRCRRGRVGRAHVEKYVLRERVSGQVDRELEISCQTQDLCSRVWKVPVCLPALPLYLSPSFALSLSWWHWCEQVAADLSLRRAPSLRAPKPRKFEGCPSQWNQSVVQKTPSFYSDGFPSTTARHTSLQMNRVTMSFTVSNITLLKY